MNMYMKLIRIMELVENKVYSWVPRYKKQILRLMVFGIFAFIFSRIPYVNLVIPQSLVLFLVVFSAIIVFKVGRTYLVIANFALILLALLMTLLGIYDAAEGIGNYIYALLALILIRYVAEK